MFDGLRAQQKADRADKLLRCAFDDGEEIFRALLGVNFFYTSL
jgi:hypothetical protein